MRQLVKKGTKWEWTEERKSDSTFLPCTLQRKQTKIVATDP